VSASASDNVIASTGIDVGSVVVTNAIASACACACARDYVIASKSIGNARIGY
jgi:hypothetical protein